MEVKVSNERLLKQVEVAISDDMVVTGDMTLQQETGALVRGEMRVVSTDGRVNKPLNVSVVNGEIQLSPSSLSVDILIKVCEAMNAIKSYFEGNAE